MPASSARGAVVGSGVGCGLMLGLPGKDLPARAWFGFGFGALAYAGIDILRDASAQARGRGRDPVARATIVAHALLGGFIGAAIGFYLDASQVSVVVAKFHRYLAAGQPPQLFDIYPLVSKWGHLELGIVTGGVSLLFVESAGGRDQLVHRRLALRHQPDVHEGLFLEGRHADSRACSRSEGLAQVAREHDPGPPLGALDVAHHQLLPAADGDADLVQPGRRDPHGAGDLPGLRR